jgi:hypothetical protein
VKVKKITGGTLSKRPTIERYNTAVKTPKIRANSKYRWGITPYQKPFSSAILFARG